MQLINTVSHRFVLDYRKKDLMLIPELATNPLAEKIINAFILVDGFVFVCVCIVNVYMCKFTSCE